MSRNYRGGGQRDRNEPPGWGSSGRLATSFAFGGANPPGQNAAVQQQQPQVHNRFQALQQQPARGRGGACYTCGQVGHQQRDCPQTSSAHRGGGGGGGGGAARPGSARVTDADVKRIVADDVRESPPWPLTCYAPDFHAGQASHNLLAGDVSFEEARAAAYSALATGGPAAAQASSQRLAETAQWRQNDRHRLASMPQAELAQQMHAAAAGQPAQGVMPQLDWSFPAGAPVVGLPPLSLPQPSAFVPQPAPGSPFPSMTQQQAAQPRMQQQLPQLPAGAGISPLLHQYVGSPQPPPVAATAPNAAQPPVASDAECWIAPAFRLGAIPETPPPPQFA